ncbi:hypothetical protein [Halonatronum saccharophilum]|uniref:hypothetical protein n=1 Tax=Halonatronum saccharophilum TaxID=150060 RepID=UPI000488062B|nr:hypothetical protein [Halonatronum saccharophilum]
MSSSIYYCPICDQDTLHQVVESNPAHYSFAIECPICSTVSLANEDTFNNYEDVRMGWDEEVKSILDSWDLQ